jgi:hypothetical protein
MEYCSHEILTKGDVEGSDNLNDYWKRLSLFRYDILGKEKHLKK